MAVLHISSRIAAVALVALVALDVALVATALRSTQTQGVDTSPVGAPSASIDLSSIAAATTSGSSSTSPVTSAGAPLQTMLVALDSVRAWRVGAGSCAAGGATLATTVDGGKTWADGKVSLQRIVRVRPTDSRAAFIVGANAACTAKVKDTSDGGGTWSSGTYVAQTWFRDPKNPLVVRAPGPALSQPCGKGAVLDLAVLTAGSAQVLCADGLVRSTTVNGSVWTDVGKVNGAVALAVGTTNAAGTYVARLGAADCTGVQILRVGQIVPASCIQVSIPKDPGQIAMSLIKGGGWLVVGNTTMRSTDNLVTWKAS